MMGFVVVRGTATLYYYGVCMYRTVVYLSVFERNEEEGERFDPGVNHTYPSDSL